MTSARPRGSGPDPGGAPYFPTAPRPAWAFSATWGRESPRRRPYRPLATGYLRRGHPASPRGTFPQISGTLSHPGGAPTGLQISGYAGWGCFQGRPGPLGVTPQLRVAPGSLSDEPPAPGPLRGACWGSALGLSAPRFAPNPPCGTSSSARTSPVGLAPRSGATPLPHSPAGPAARGTWARRDPRTRRAGRQTALQTRSRKLPAPPPHPPPLRPPSSWKFRARRRFPARPPVRVLGAASPAVVPALSDLVPSFLVVPPAEAWGPPPVLPLDAASSSLFCPTPPPPARDDQGPLR